MGNCHFTAPRCSTLRDDDCADDVDDAVKKRFGGARTSSPSVGKPTHTPRVCSTGLCSDPRSTRSRSLTGLERPVNDRSMSSAEIDAYLDGIEEPKRSTLQLLREAILEEVPDAEEGISYKLPAFRLRGKVVAGFAAFKNHLSYLPHSGSVFSELLDDVAPYRTSKGALQFPVDSPLPKELVAKLLAVRIAQAFSE
jgi:uncharacterized protein YdhG (YjbR/CyaY superfamily)